MPALCPPDAAVRLSFLAAMAEFRAEGRGAATDDTMLGREIREFGRNWQDPDWFQAYVSFLRGQGRRTRRARLGTSRRPPCGGPRARSTWGGWPSGTGSTSGCSSGVGTSATTCGRPPGGRGYATAMLAAALPVARSLGIGPALVTCDQGNAASRQVIGANGGVLEDQRGRELRFWVPTS